MDILDRDSAAISMPWLKVARSLGLVLLRRSRRELQGIP